MRNFIPYKYSLLDLRNHLSLNLISYTNIIDFDNTVKGIVYDYFGMNITNTPNSMSRWGSTIYFKDSGFEGYLDVSDINEIFKQVNQTFWYASKLFNYILSHCDSNNVNFKPTDCYIDIHSNLDITVYVPEIRPSLLSVSETTLLHKR